MRSVEDIYENEDPDVALELLSRRAHAGDPIAQFYVGHLCAESGEHGESDAAAWYECSSNGGNLEGRHWFASYLYHGFGIEQDYRKH